MVDVVVLLLSVGNLVAEQSIAPGLRLAMVLWSQHAAGGTVVALERHVETAE